MKRQLTSWIAESFGLPGRTSPSWSVLLALRGRRYPFTRCVEARAFFPFVDECAANWLRAPANFSVIS